MAQAVAWDETAKTTATTGELAFTLDEELAYSRAITVPVLLVVGSSDALFCGTALPCSRAADICERERGAFPASRHLSAAIVASAGHSLNLHTSADRVHSLINGWLDRPQSTSRPADRTACGR